jgi:hypothetical protein
MPGFDGTGPGGMGPMTGGGRGWCNPYGPLRAGYTPYPAPYRPYPMWGASYTPMARPPAWGYALGRPRWGLRGFFGRGMGRAGRGRRGW